MGLTKLKPSGCRACLGLNGVQVGLGFLGRFRGSGVYRGLGLAGMHACKPFPNLPLQTLDTHTQTDRDKHTQTDRHTHTHTPTDTYRHTQTHTDTHTHTRARARVRARAPDYHEVVTTPDRLVQHHLPLPRCRSKHALAGIQPYILKELQTTMVPDPQHHKTVTSRHEALTPSPRKFSVPSCCVSPRLGRQMLKGSWN